jgi:type IV secretory pathway VirB3-like protein
MQEAETDPLFTALTSPVVFMGVPLYYFGTNLMALGIVLIATTDLFLFSMVGLCVNIPLHYLGRYLMARDHHFITIFWTHTRLPPVRTRSFWKCRSFGP